MFVEADLAVIRDAEPIHRFCPRCIADLKSRVESGIGLETKIASPVEGFKPSLQQAVDHPCCNPTLFEVDF